ncbi:MAG: 3-dehydroquinate dehydratase / shikimate dehydrogenase [Bryobacterales bacterium]|jgi:3-dehydroquinate dehydratase/shikimate dehydrogenase|nr:3-dehydroquinate dehydratase / shikimate dehydrogenase [Bryobacterales bacterium]
MTQRRALPRICIALGLPDVPRLMEQARREAEAGENFLEFRLDYLPEPAKGAQAIARFLEEYPTCTVLATCRRHQNHGRFNGSIEEQLKILELGIQFGARAVDVEIETAEVVPERCAELRSRAYLIVSWHHFETTPPLDPVLKRMCKVPADVYKLVSTARKPSDTGRILTASKMSPKIPLVTLAMGEIGFPSRVLSTAMGAVFTYAAPAHVQGTASGQINARQLRSMYRIDKFTKAAKIFAVVADPVRHSMSPTVHNRAFQSRRMDAVYVPLLVNQNQLRDFFQFATELPLAGFSVTIPHKRRIMRYLDQIDPLAKRIGAVNTVVRKAGKWRGSNTDAEAVSGPLAKLTSLPKATALIIGNGGAARGAACALADAGAKVALTGRNPDRVRALSRLVGGEPMSHEQVMMRHFDIVINATPVGMWPNWDECPFEDKIPGEIVFDMVYNPLETLLIKRAREQGKQVIPGLKMFIEQAVRQFEVWTGESAPRAAMEAAAIDALETRNSEQKT